MKFTGIIARIDGQPDSEGDTFGPDVELPKHRLPVYLEFDSEFVLGRAQVKKRGNNIVAEVDINLPPEVATKMTAVIGGKIKAREGKKITSCSVNSVGITRYPVDRSLPKLRKKRK